MQFVLAAAVMVGSLFGPRVPHGITGQVTIGPTLPICYHMPCAPLPYATTLTVAGRGRSVTVHTDAAGRYSVKVPPGAYVVTGCGAGIFSRSVAVTVSRRGMVIANLACDTGLR